MSKFTTANMFNVLDNDEDSDTEVTVTETRQQQPRKAQTGGQASTSAQSGPAKEKRTTGRDARDSKKPSGVPAEPHPLDRRSGTGRG